MITLRNFELTDVGYMIASWPSGHMKDFPLTEKELTELIGSFQNKEYHGKYYEEFAICLNSDIIGHISLFETGDSLFRTSEDKVSAGLEIDGRYRNKGYGTEAIHGIKNIAAKKGYKYLVSNCRKDNYPSIKLHQKCGYKMVGEGIGRHSGKEIYYWSMEL